MRYILFSITPDDKEHGKFEIVFSNSENEEVINIATLANDTWCLYSESGKPLKFYSSVEDLIEDFAQDLGEE